MPPSIPESRCSTFRFKVSFSRTADWADPIIRDILKRCTRFYAAIGIALLRVVNIATDATNKTLYELSLFAGSGINQLSR
jgi:hypothetical protein